MSQRRIRWSGRTRLARVAVPVSLGVWAMFAAASAGLPKVFDKISRNLLP